MNVRRSTVVAEPRWLVGLVWMGFPVVGAGAVWLLKAAAGWVASWPWAPVQGFFKLVASIPEPAATLGALGVGAAAGLVLALIAAAERLTVSVDDQGVVLTRDNKERGFDRALVAGVFLDGKKIVLLGHSSQELAREASDLNAGLGRRQAWAGGRAWADRPAWAVDDLDAAEDLDAGDDLDAAVERLIALAARPADRHRRTGLVGGPGWIPARNRVEWRVAAQRGGRPRRLFIYGNDQGGRLVPLGLVTRSGESRKGAATWGFLGLG